MYKFNYRNKKAHPSKLGVTVFSSITKKPILEFEAALAVLIPNNQVFD